MRRELKNLFNQLTKQAKGDGYLGGPNLGWRLYYIFLRRYDAIYQDFNLPQFGYRLEKYFKEDIHCYPYEDLIKPFFEFLREKNPNTFDRVDIEAFFKHPDPLDILDPNEVKNLNKAIKESGISNFTLDNFSVEEFDEFFVRLIEKTESKSEKNVWRRFLNKEFAQFISEKLPNHDNCLFIGDETAEIAYQSGSDKGLKILAGNYDSLLWYYLRVILSGKCNVKIQTDDLTPYVNAKPDFIFLNPPVGKISKRERNDLSGKFGTKFTYRTYEGFYASLAMSIKERGGSGLFLMPSSFLHRNTKDYKQIRESLINNKALKSVIRFPKGIFGPSTNISFSLIEIDFSNQYEEVLFIDGMEIDTFLSPEDTEELELFFNEILVYCRGGLDFYPYKQSIELNEITEKTYSLAFSNYFNVNRNVNEHIRSREEKLISLTDVLKRIRLKPGNKISNVPLLGITELAENLAEYEVDASSLPKVDEIKRAKKLDRSAILIGKIVGSVKPSYYKYDGQAIYIKPNILAFEVPDKLDLQYVIQELRSDFVTEQLKKIETASVIPSFSNQVLKNIYLRIPPLAKQKEYYKNAVASLAKQSIKDLKISDQRFRLVESKILSSFKHDFMQILLKVSSNIDVLDNYLQLLHNKDVISLEDSVFLENKGDVENPDKVKSVLDRLKVNHAQSIKFLEDEVKKLSEDKKTAKKEIIDVRAFVKKWKKGIDENGFKIEISENDLVRRLNKGGESPYKIKIVEQDLRRILGNLLNNAVKHGFDKNSKDNIFSIDLGMPASGPDSVYVGLTVRNNGRPLPEDFSYDDLFEYKHKGPDSKGDGIGGYSILKAVKNNEGTILFNNENEDREFPFRLLINFPSLIV